MTGHAHLITALDMLQSLVVEWEALFVPAVKPNNGTHQLPRAYSDKRIEYLLGCLGGNFADTRSKALEILMVAPLPFPGYESSSDNDLLLQSALAKLDGNRKTDADSGSLVLQAMCRNSSTSSAPNSEALNIIRLLLDRLDSRVDVAEKDLARGIESGPMHGSLLSIARIISSTPWKSSSSESLSQLKAVSHRAVKLVHRIWGLSRVILSSEGSSAADHEIARIYDILKEGGEDIAEDSHDTAHINLLSNCWRAVKEASNLIADIFVTTMALESTAADGPFWSSAEIKAVGDLYLTWLYHIRHRGTFSHIAPDFERFINVTSQTVMPGESDRTLREYWLSTQLDIISEGTASTTRRSAAIPFCVLALVQSSKPLFTLAHDRLVGLAQNPESSDKTKVHALHTIRVTVLDARQSKFLGEFYEKTAITALSGCKSPDWSVRNSALLLFAQLATRIFGKGLNSPGTIFDKHIGIPEWDSRYPLLLPAFKTLLETAVQDRQAESSAILVLSVLRHLESRQTVQEQIAAQQELQELASDLMCSREIKMRQAAAEASASLTPKNARFTTCLDAISKPSGGSNARHGQLLLAKALLDRGIEVDQDDSRRLLEAALDCVDRQRTPPPLVMAAATDIVSSCWVLAGQWSELRSRCKQFSRSMVGSDPLQPGFSLWKVAAQSLETICTDVQEDAQIPLLDIIQSRASADEKIELLESILEDERPCEQEKRLFDVLSKIYNASSHVPLREAILPVLGKLAVSVV